MVIADQSKDGIFDGDCLKLGDLHSDAVDYPKSGQPVPLDTIPRLKFRERPDWNAPETVTSESARFYESPKALGMLFRSIELPAPGDAKATAREQKKRVRNGENLTVVDILADFHDDDATDDDLDIVR